MRGLLNVPGLNFGMNFQLFIEAVFGKCGGVFTPVRKGG
jgi:hypothetical protein